MTADTRTTDRPARLAAHELVLLHGQPGSPADWQRVAARLPAQLHAVAADRPGYGSSRFPAGGFAANARAVLDDLDARGITRAVLVGRSYGGGVALAAASLAPPRVEAVILLASVGPGCVNGWDKLLAAPGAGQLCALVAWRLTPWMARARLARIARRRGRPLRPDEHVNWQVWGRSGPRTPPAVAHLPGRAARPAARAWRAGARHLLGAGAGPPARRPRGHPGTRGSHPPARPRPARCPPAARPGRGSSPAQASPRCRRRRDELRSWPQTEEADNRVERRSHTVGGRASL